MSELIEVLTKDGSYSLRSIFFKENFHSLLGALEETQKDNAAEIAEQTMDRGYNVSARVHCYIWGNQIGT